MAAGVSCPCRANRTAQASCSSSHSSSGRNCTRANDDNICSKSAELQACRSRWPLERTRERDRSCMSELPRSCIVLPLVSASWQAAQQAMERCFKGMAYGEIMSKGGQVRSGHQPLYGMSNTSDAHVQVLAGALQQGEVQLAGHRLPQLGQGNQQRQT